MKINVNEMRLKPRYSKKVYQSLKDGWFSSAGPAVTEFEEKWAQYCDRNYGIAVSSGTAALITAAQAIGLKAGDEVIVPDFTIISCSLAISMTGATIVPIDCDSQTLNIDVSKIEQKINKNTKAIMVVHIFGQPVNMNEILRIAKIYNLKVIEDAAEAHGAKYKTNRIKKEQWVKCGSEGDISIFSFYANKLITTGEGGMVVTNNSDLAEKSRLIRNLGFSKERDYIHSTFGYQFRMTNMQASLGIPQINEMPKILQTKNEIYESYKTLLSDHPAISFLKQEKWAKSCHWVTPIILDANYGNAKNFRAELANVGIETRPFFTGIHQQPIYKDNNFYMEKDFKCSAYATKQGIILPSGLNTRIKQIRYVSGEILRILNKSRS